METPNDQVPAVPAGQPPARSVPAAGPLSEDDFIDVRLAVTRRKAIRSAARVANWSSTSMIVLGAGAFVLALLMNSPVSMAAAFLVCAIGLVEFLGYRRMSAASRSASTILGTNQLVLLALVVAWCVIQMATFTPEKMKASIAAEAPDLASALPEMQKSIETLGPIITYVFYSLVIVCSIAFQGGLALYYFTRKRHLEAWHRDTPPWVMRLFSELQM